MPVDKDKNNHSYYSILKSIVLKQVGVEITHIQRIKSVINTAGIIIVNTEKDTPVLYINRGLTKYTRHCKHRP